MRKVFMVLIWSASWPVTAVAQEECECRPYPFRPEPPCFRICVEIITQRADLDELQEVFRLSEETMAAIAEARQSGVAKISEELIYVVSEEVRRSDKEQVQDFLEREGAIFLDFGSKFEAEGDTFLKEPKRQLHLEEQLGGQAFE